MECVSIGDLLHDEVKGHCDSKRTELKMAKDVIYFELTALTFLLLLLSGGVRSEELLGGLPKQTNKQQT